MEQEGLSGSTGTMAFDGPSMVLISMEMRHHIDWGGSWECHLMAKHLPWDLWAQKIITQESTSGIAPIYPGGGEAEILESATG